MRNPPSSRDAKAAHRRLRGASAENPTTPITIVDRAKAIVYGRGEANYGHPSANFETTAEMLSAYLKRRGFMGADQQLLPRDFANIMILVKVAREANKPSDDNLVDIAGYAETAYRVTTGR